MADSFNRKDYAHMSTVELKNYAARLQSWIERAKDGNSAKPWNENGPFECKMTERLQGLLDLIEGRETMEDFKSGPPKPQTISELYWKPKEEPTPSPLPTSPGTTSKPGLTAPEGLPTSSSVAEVRKEMEFHKILKEGRELREKEESLRRSARIAEKRKAIHALLPTPGMPISLQLHKKQKEDKTETGSLEDSDSGSSTELEIDPLLE
jgi:hypothetical protein